MKDRSDDPSHHERTLLPRSYISLFALVVTLTNVCILVLSAVSSSFRVSSNKNIYRISVTAVLYRSRHKRWFSRVATVHYNGVSLVHCHCPPQTGLPLWRLTTLLLIYPWSTQGRQLSVRGRQVFFKCFFL